MRRRTSLILAILISSLLVSAGFSTAATVDEILKDHLEAMGGRQAIEAIKSLKITSSMSIGGMTGSGVTYYKAPDMYRADVKLPVISTSQGCYEGDCWMSDPQGLTHGLGHELKRMMVTQICLENTQYAMPDEFKGEVRLLTQDAMLNTDTLGLRYYAIEIKPDSGAPAKLWINKDSYLLRQVSIETDLGLLITEFFKYKKIAGVQFPFDYVERTGAGLVSAESKVDSVEINPELPDTLFIEPNKRVVDTDWTLSSDSLLIPCKFWRNHLYFDVTIDGKGPYSLIFDSGAGGLALSTGLVKALGLKVVGQMETHGVGGVEKSDLYQLDSLKVGGLKLDSLPVSAIDFSGLEDSETQKIDGIIGYPVLSTFIVAVDYGRNALILYPRATRLTNAGQQCNLTIDFRLPYINATVNDSIRGVFRIDTGSISTIDLNSPFVRKNNLVDTANGDYIELTAMGVGGTTSGLVGMLNSFSFCNFKEDSVWAGFSLSSQGIFAGPSTAGNIGAGILKAFRLTFDYPNGHIYFQPLDDFDFISRTRNMAGITLAKKDGKLTVTHLLKGHSAAKVLNEGDILLKIDDVDIKSKSVPAVERLLVGGNRTIEIEYERAGKHHSGKIRLESFF